MTTLFDEITFVPSERMVRAVWPELGQSVIDFIGIERHQETGAVRLSVWTFDGIGNHKHWCIIFSADQWGEYIRLSMEIAL